ncbi:MAG: hypothetical protein LH609_16635 [Rudanella sp.]|nr:hypothetical protein [Rudanella sp.]
MEAVAIEETVDQFQSTSELTAKSKGYFAAGTCSYWLVQPLFRTIFILLPDGTELVFHDDILTDPTNGISVDLRKVFR